MGEKEVELIQFLIEFKFDHFEITATSFRDPVFMISTKDWAGARKAMRLVVVRCGRVPIGSQTAH